MTENRIFKNWLLFMLYIFIYVLSIITLSINFYANKLIKIFICLLHCPRLKSVVIFARRMLLPSVCEWNLKNNARELCFFNKNVSLRIDAIKEIVLWILYLTIRPCSPRENGAIRYKLYWVSRISRSYFIRDSKTLLCLRYNCSTKYRKIEKFHYLRFHYLLFDCKNTYCSACNTRKYQILKIRKIFFSIN